jgi:uncharacterized membrane protein (UPF0127 family)
MPRYGNLMSGLLVVAAFACVSVFCGCRSPVTGSQVSVRFESEGSTTSEFRVEVVATPEDRARGLMFRKSINDDQGMLFLFPREQPLAFWMKNTFIPLDMVFVSGDWRVVGVLKNVPPLNEDRRSVETPSQYVLEFGAGVAEKHNIMPGAKVVVRGSLPSAQ